MFFWPIAKRTKSISSGRILAIWRKTRATLGTFDGCRCFGLTDMAFTVPRDGEVFIEQVLDRCKNLISSGIWEGLQQVRLDMWMKNFISDTERYFGACVLDGLIYRSEKQTVALMQQLFQRTLVDLVRRHPPPGGTGSSFFEMLRQPFSPPGPMLRVVPVIRWGDPPTKSGPALARMYRRHLGLNEQWMV